MIGLDTNVIVRYLVQDDPAQSAAATRAFEDRLSSENRGFVAAIFSDCLIGERALAAGARKTLSFDEDACSCDLFEFV